MKVGCAAIFQNQELLRCLSNESSIYSAEITVIDLTMNIIANHKSYKIIIHSDSKSVLQALQNKNTSTPLITRLLNKMITLSKNNRDPCGLGLKKIPTAYLQRGKTPPMNVLDMALNNLMVRRQ